jgi:HEAT repeat protein
MNTNRYNLNCLYLSGFWYIAGAWVMRRTRVLIYILFLAIVVPIAFSGPALAGEVKPEKSDQVEKLYESLTSNTKSELDKFDAAQQLIDLHTPEADKAIRDALSFNNSSTVCVTVAAVYKKNATIFISDLLNCTLGTKDEKIKLQMIDALAFFVADKKGGKNLEEQLGTIITDKMQSETRRANAVAVFGEVTNQHKGIGFILLKVKDNDSDLVVGAAVEAIKKLTGIDEKWKLDVWRKWWDENKTKTREKWIEEHNKKLKAKLDKAIESRIRTLNKHWDLLAKQPDKQILIKDLKEKLCDKNEPVKLRASAALRIGDQRVRDQDTVKRLLLVIDEQDVAGELLSAAVCALGKIGITKVNGNEAAVPTRLQKLYDNAQIVQKTRVVIIGAIAELAKQAGQTPVGRGMSEFILSKIDPETEKSGLLISVLEAIGDVGDSRAVGPVTDLVLYVDNSGNLALSTDVSGELKRTVDRVLGKLKFGKDDPPNNRAQAIKCLLLLLADMEDQDVRRLAAASLAVVGVGVPEVITGLDNAVRNEPNIRQRPQLTEALSKVDTTGRGADAILWALGNSPMDAESYINHLKTLVSKCGPDGKFNYKKCLYVAVNLRERGHGSYLPGFLDMNDIKNPAKGDNEKIRFDCKYELGRFYLDSRDYKKAVPLFGELVAADSQRLDYLLGHADANFGTGSFKSAFDKYRDITKNANANPKQVTHGWDRMLAGLDQVKDTDADWVKKRIDEVLKDADPKPPADMKKKLEELRAKVMATAPKPPDNSKPKPRTPK